METHFKIKKVKAEQEAAQHKELATMVKSRLARPLQDLKVLQRDLANVHGKRVDNIEGLIAHIEDVIAECK